MLGAAVVLPSVPMQALAQPASPRDAVAHLEAPGAQPAQTGGSAGPAVEAQPREGWSTFYHWWTRSDGKRQMQIFSEPMFHEVDGAWKEIDTKLTSTPSPDYPAAATNGLRPVRFGKSASRLVTLDLTGGPVILQGVGLNIGSPLVSGSDVTYANVATDTDLVYRVTPGAIKEELVLKSNKAPHQFSFRLTDPNGLLGKAHAQPGDAVLFDAVPAPDVHLGLDRPVAYERTGHPGPEAGSAHMTLTSASRGFNLRVSLDPRWAARHRYPLVLDPTVTFPNANGAPTFAWSSNYNGGNAIMGQDTNLYVGSSSGSSGAGVWRSYLQFDLSGIPWGSTIADPSTLGLYKNACLLAAGGGCGPNHTVEVHQMTGAWSTSSTWNQLSAITSGSVLASGVENSTVSNVWHTFDIAGEVQRWVKGTDPNYGVAVKIQDESPNVGGPQYYSDRTSNSGLRPYLTVTYAPNATHGYPPAPPSPAGRDNFIFSAGLPPAPNRSLFVAADNSAFVWQRDPDNTQAAGSQWWNSVASPYLASASSGSFGNAVYGHSDVTSNGDTVWMLGLGGLGAEANVTKWQRSGATWTQQFTQPEPKGALAQLPIAIYYDSGTSLLWSAYIAQVLNGTTLESHLIVNNSSDGGHTFSTEKDLGKVSSTTAPLAGQFVTIGYGGIGLIFQDTGTLYWSWSAFSTVDGLYALTALTTVDGSTSTSTSWQSVGDGLGSAHLLVSTAATGVQDWGFGGGGWHNPWTLESGFHRLSVSTDGTGFWLATDETTAVSLRKLQGLSWNVISSFSSAVNNVTDGPSLPPRVDPHSIPVVWSDRNGSYIDRFDDLAPTATIYGPADGSSISGTVLVSAAASDEGLGVPGVQRVDFFVDRGAGFLGFLGSSSTADSNGRFNYSWNTAELDTAWSPFGTGVRLWPPGAYQVYAIAYDYKGNSSQSPRALCYLQLQDLGVHQYRPNYELSLAGGARAVVNLSNGNLNLAQTDLSEPTVIGALQTGRAYNSLDATDNGFGSGWAASAYGSVGLVFRKLVDHSSDPTYPSGSVELDDEVGGQHWYLSDGARGYQPFLQDLSHLSHNGDGSWTLSSISGTRYDFTSAGQPSAITPASAGTQHFTYAYNAGGQLSSVAEPTGRSISFGYTGADISTVSDFNAARSWSYGYTGTDLTSVTDPISRVTRYSYSNHLLTSVTDPNGELTLFDYDGSNRVYRIRERHNNTDLTTIVDYSNPNTPRVTSFRGNLSGCDPTCQAYYTTTYGMDAAKRLVQITRQLPSGAAVSESLGWDEPSGLKGAARPRNLLTSQTDFLGNRTSYVYDEVGNQISQTDPAGTSLTNYDAGYSGLQAEYYPNMNLTPATGFPVRRLDPGINYNWNGTSPAPGIGGTSWSARWTGWLNVPTTGNYQFSTVSDDGVAMAIDGRVLVNDWTDHAPTTDTSPQVVLAAGLHQLGVVYYQNQGGSQLVLSWSGPNFASQPIPGSSLQPGLGLVTSSVDHLGHTKTSTYDDPFRRHQVSQSQSNTDLDGAVSTLTTKFDYTDPATGQTDVYGRLHSKTSPRGNTGSTPDPAYATTYAYYAAGASATNPCAAGGSANQGGMLQSTTAGTSGAVTAISRVYDAFGNDLAVTDGKGLTCRTFDAANRLLTMLPPDRSSALSYVYDADNNLRQAVDPVNGTSNYTYDDLNRLVSSQDVLGGTATTYSYDVYTTTTETDTTTDLGGTTGSTLDQLGRAVGEDYTPAGGAVQHFSYGYDSDSRLIQTTYPSGIVVNRGLDAMGRTQSLANLASNGSSIASYNDTYDPKSQRLTEDGGLGHWCPESSFLDSFGPK